MQLTHFFLAATNIYGILPFIFANGIFEKSLVVATVVSSVAMHLSETKHTLMPSPVLDSWSNIFLNMDRGCAILSMIYLFPRWCKHGDFQQVFILSAGLLASGLGEMTGNVILYSILHTIWHMAAYLTMTALFALY